MFLPSSLDFARGGDVAVALVDAIEAAQQRRLAAAARADERGDDAVLDVDGDVDERLELAVPEAQISGGDAVLDGSSGRLIGVGDVASLHPKIPFTYS